VSTWLVTTLQAPGLAAMAMARCDARTRLTNQNLLMATGCGKPGWPTCRTVRCRLRWRMPPRTKGLRR